MSGALDHNATVAIRRATEADAEALATFGARVFAETFGPENTPEDMAAYLRGAYGRDIQRAEVATEGNVFFVAGDAGEIAAYAFLRDAPLLLAERDEKAVEIARFYVDASRRGTGLAHTLMGAAVEEARSRDARTLWLGVWERNPRAIRFYEKCGFRDVGGQEFRLGSDVQRDRVMVRVLKPRERGGR